ncbi:hypothetical protein KY49_703 [Burkholderia sp. MSHR3999]|uniref:DUF1064 domain-containing protein n=1 Tax=Burkholderia sp. MSHR3999 TaxID=1542965 RepID=UPI0005B6A6DE|nr:DUF1064 domain-containing protein [Burkholderia sp. MSHR3999]KIP14845.1 hypothetical protein KY49_703 [Burkholderia sp. MSHR3999]
MTKRSTSLHYPEGTTRVGTARVRDDSRPAMTAAQSLIYEATGNRPQVDSGFDEIADGFNPGAPVPLSMQKPERAPKYRNRKCEHDGIRFDSEKERSRYFELVRMQTVGLIRDLQLQVSFVLTERMQRDDGTWERASKYVADFVYVDVITGRQIVEDVKSPITRKNPTYVQKRKDMLAVHKISIREV